MSVDPSAEGLPPAGQGIGQASNVTPPGESGAVPTPGSLGAPASAGPTPEDAPASTDPRVDDAISRLAELEGLPLAEQVAVFGDIHRRLEAVLADPSSRG